MEASVPATPDRWEYLVIHLNVEPGPQAPPAAPAKGADGGAASDGAPKPVFSESFLKKEFPNFYEERPAAEAPPSKPQHPAQQLQAFLNGQGMHGWELVGLYPVGALSMLFFRRRLLPPAESSPQAPERTVQPPSPAAGASRPVAAEAVAPAAGDSVLETLMARLAALEARLPAPEAAGTLDGLVLTAEKLARLSSEPAMASQAAARLLGLRSAASLANLGARHGYNPGLCKEGPNGMVAVYRGNGASERGGHPPRLWIVVNRERLLD